jgi:hypothetical protein
MATLRTSNGLSVVLPGLGKIQDFEALSEKRITKCVRGALRKEYSERLELVSCSARLMNSEWHGVFKLDGIVFSYAISAQ